jgi:hypothetical protein
MGKLGIKLQGAVDVQAVIEAAPRVVVVDVAAVADGLAVLTSLHDALGERCLLVAQGPRLAEDWAAFWDGPAGQSVDGGLAAWWTALESRVTAAPFAFWMGPDAFDQPDRVVDYVAFEVARVARLAEVGARACAGNFATGLPNAYDPVWAEVLTLGRAVQLHRGVLGLREFGALYMWTGYGSNEWLETGFRAERKFPEDHRYNADLALHYRELYQDVLEPVGLGGLPLVITACGLGPVAPHITTMLSADGAPTGGWQSCAATWRRRDGIQDPVDFYLNQMEWYAAQIERDTFVIGAAVDGVGRAGDGGLTGEDADHLLARIAADPAAADPAYPAAAPAQVSPAGIPAAMLAEQTEAPTVPERTGKRFYVMVDHPEIFDALWREAEPLAEEARVRLSWQEVGGRFIIQMEHFDIWRRVYQYGQILAQQLDARLEGGEINTGPDSTDINGDHLVQF